jgi:hypothetical protein
MSLVDAVRRQLVADLRYLGASRKALEANDLAVLVDWKQQVLEELMSVHVRLGRRRIRA